MTMQDSITAELRQAFAPEFLQVENESHGHNVPPGSESHFKVVLVSRDFEGRGRVQRHQAVYKVLAEALANGVHALALHTYTSAEWDAKGVAPVSPDCMGGSKS